MILSRFGSLTAGRAGRYWAFGVLLLLILPLGLLKLISPWRHLDEFLVSLAVYAIPALWGGTLAFKAKRRLDQEYELLDHAEREALKDRLEFLSGGSPFIGVDNETHRRYLPSLGDGAGPTPASVRMVQSLCSDAMGNRFSPISTTSQAYAMEFGDGARRLRTPQTIALRLGILCTFVGLLISLDAVGKIFQDGIGDSQHRTSIGRSGPPATTPQDALKQLEPKISQTVVGLTAAFGASISGLVAAIALQGFVELLLQQQRLMAKKIEDTVGTLVYALSRAQSVAGLRDLDHRLQQLREQLHAHQHEVKAAVSEAVSVMDSHAEDTRLGAAALNEQKQTLAEISARHQQMLGQVREAFDGLVALEGRVGAIIRDQSQSLEVAGGKMAQSLSEAIAQTGDTLGSTLRTQIAEMSSGGATLDRAAQRIEEAAASLAASVPPLGGDPALLDRLTDALDRVAASHPASGRPDPTRAVLVMMVPILFLALAGIGIGAVALLTQPGADLAVDKLKLLLHP